MHYIDYGNSDIVKKSALKELDAKFKDPICGFVQKVLMPVKFEDGFSIEHIDWSLYAEPTVRILGTYQTFFVCDFIVDGVSMIETLEKENKAKRIELQQLDELFKDTEISQQPLEPSASQSTAAEEVAKQPDAPQEVTTPAAPITETPAEAPAVQPEAVSTSLATLSIDAAADVTTNTNDEVSTVSKVDDDATSVTTLDASAAATAAAADASADLPSNKELAFISHVDHPNRFYMQLNSDSNAIDHFQQSLQIVAPQLPALADFRAGQMCIGKYAYDDQWYRAKIIDTDGEITSIQFIDYGNTDSITNNALLKAPDSTLMERKPFAMACSLPIEPRGSVGAGSEWAEQACDKLRMLSIEVPLSFELISKYKDVNYVKLYLVGGRDFVKELIQEEVADPLEIVRSGEICFVSHINSLDDFYIQVESDTDVLQKIEEHLEGNVDAAVLKSPPIGTVCSARFEDGRLYRAKIIDVLPDSSYHVEFVDYGNKFRTTEVRSLIPEIAQLPHLRRRCTLKLPNHIEYWSEEAEKQFQQLASDGATEFLVHLIRPGKKACIELFMKDINVSEQLGGLCIARPAPPVVVDEQETPFNEKTPPHSINVNDFPSGRQFCLIAHANSPADFFVHFQDKMDDLNLIAMELGKADELQVLDNSTVEIGSIVAALYPMDGFYYRAKVVERHENGFNVLFMDYGNICLVEKMLQLPDILKTIVPLATNCSLADERLAQFTDTERNQFMNFMQEDPEPTFQVEAIQTAIPKSIVHLYRDGFEVLDFIRQSTSAGASHSILSDIIEEASNASNAHE